MLVKSIRNIRRSFSSLLEGNWDLTPDQQAIQETARKFALQELAPYVNEWDEKKHFPKDVVKKSAELGFAGLYCSSEYGGCGLSRLDTSLVFEALSTGCIGITTYITVHNMCCWVIDTFGSKDQKEAWLPAMFNFDKFASYCLTEPHSGSDAAALSTKAELQGDYYVINGSKMFITGGEQSNIYLVMCKTGHKEISCIAVEKGTPGLGFGKPESKLGWHSHPTQMVTFDNVKVPKSNMIGEPGVGFKIALMALEGGRVNIASVSLGGAWFALERALDYMHSRTQFGSKLSDFQYLRFKMSEAFTQLTASRLLVRHSAKLLDEKNSEKIAISSMAKLFATDNCFEVANLALQMHGGYGVIKEYGVERVVRDLRFMQIVEGTNEIMRMVIAREALKEK